MELFIRDEIMKIQQEHSLKDIEYDKLMDDHTALKKKFKDIVQQFAESQRQAIELTTQLSEIKFKYQCETGNILSLSNLTSIKNRLPS